jgi:hypothetical protein
MRRCAECPGDPSCWDFVTHPDTGKPVKVSFCKIAIAQEKKGRGGRNRGR